MLRLLIAGATLLAASTSIASAMDCVSDNKYTDEFTNNCEYEVVISFRTVGGGCFMHETAKFSLKSGLTVSQPLLSETCGNVGNFNVEWVACKAAEYNSGACKLSF